RPALARSARARARRDRSCRRGQRRRGGGAGLRVALETRGSACAHRPSAAATGFQRSLGRAAPSFRGTPVMTLLATTHPVQLLADAKGIYGIGVVGSSGEDRHRQPLQIILRPDRLLEAVPRPAALQMIIGGFRHGMFSNMSEERLRRTIHHEMLRRKGLTWP